MWPFDIRRKRRERERQEKIDIEKYEAKQLMKAVLIEAHFSMMAPTVEEIRESMDLIRSIDEIEL